MSVFGLSTTPNTRTRNESAVLLELLHHEHVSQVHLAELTALSATTITKTQIYTQQLLQASQSEIDKAHFF